MLSKLPETSHSEAAKDPNEDLAIMETEPQRSRANIDQVADANLDSEQLASASADDLNNHLKRQGLTKPKQKGRKRTSKNRGSGSKRRNRHNKEDAEILMDIQYLDKKVHEGSCAIQSLLNERESIISYIQEYGVSREEIIEFLYTYNEN